MLDLRISVDGRPEHPLELALRLGRPAAVRALGDFIETLITVVDDLTGDPDMEEDDPSGDPLDGGEEEEWRPGGIAFAKPIYGIDQRKPPLNSREAYREYCQVPAGGQ